jgi:hypothetical protein
MSYGEIYSVFQSTQAPLTISVLHQNIMADFSRCVGGLGMFVQDGSSATGFYSSYTGCNLIMALRATVGNACTHLGMGVMSPV